MSEETVLVDRRQGTLVLRLNRPGRRNAWGPDMSRRLCDLLAAAADDGDVRGVVLTGADNGAFSSGADIGKEEVHAKGPGRYLGEMGFSGHEAFDRLLRFPKPLVCAVNGYAIGFGFLAPLCCDVILASREAEFRMTHVKLGILPAYGGLGRLAQWVGRGRAIDIGMTGRPVGADEALRIGLVSEICEPEELDARSIVVAETLGALPPLAFRAAKESIYHALEGGQIATNAIEDLYRIGLLQQTADTKEAHVAWRERREPRYRGE